MEVPATRRAGVWLGNRFVPWAVRKAYRDGPVFVNGVWMQVPRPPEWGGGGEYHMALGTYEARELSYLLRTLEPGDAFVDVGSHIGYFSLPLAKRGVRVLAVEPTATSLSNLRHNIALNSLDNITVAPVAAGDSDGEATFYSSLVSPMWNSLEKDGAGEGAIATRVRVRSVDSLVAELGWPRVDAIKVDVEGAEVAVLRGCSETLKANPKAKIFVEMAGGDRMAVSLETLDQLRSMGYSFRRFGLGRDPVDIEYAEIVARMSRRYWQELLFNLVAFKR
jgi:FkbM family methyltransferase